MEIETFNFPDPGATINLIWEVVAKQLNYKGNAKDISFWWFQGQVPQFQSTTVSLTVKSRGRTFEADLEQVSTVHIRYLKLPCPPKELMEIRSNYPCIKDVKLVDVIEQTILIRTRPVLHLPVVSALRLNERVFKQPISKNHRDKRMPFDKNYSQREHTTTFIPGTTGIRFNQPRSKPKSSPRAICGPLEDLNRLRIQTRFRKK